MYPADRLTPRTIENLPGEIYDPAKTKQLFAEDIIEITDDLRKVEDEIEDVVKPAVAGKQASLGFTPENVANKDTNTALGTDDTKYPSQKAVKSYIDAAIAAAKLALHPVGSIYIHTSNTNPSTFIGGTWAAWGSGRVPVGVDTGQTEFNTVEKTGGAKTHTLAISEMPSHDHPYGGDNNYLLLSASASAVGQAGASNLTPWRDWNWRGNVKAQGGGGAHNNLAPYITCYMFKRTA